MKLRKKYGYLWVTLMMFVLSVAGHWIFGWFAYLHEQKSLGQPVEVGDFAIETARDTFENWQSEFLQLIWQVGGLAILLWVGSPQSKEGDDRKEEKLDEILKKLDPVNAERILRELEAKYPKH